MPYTTLFRSRRNLERAQDLEDQAGGTIRMTADGEVPSDNPAWDDDADEYVFTTGNRNVQALAVNPTSGDLWAVDHGPFGGDEVNRLDGRSEEHTSELQSR